MKHNLLIVDDDALIVNTLKKLFEDNGVMVFTATTPEEAKTLLEKYKPQALILDLLLTREDGSTGILDFIKSKEELATMPVVVLTNLDKPELKEMLLSQGVKEYIIKGTVNLDELRDKVLGYLEPKDSAKG